jgi:hypothetical protein
MNVNRHVRAVGLSSAAKVSRPPTATRTARFRDALHASVPLARVRATVPTVPIDASRRIRRGGPVRRALPASVL